MIPHSHIRITEADKQAVAEVLASGQIAQGAEVRRFEKQTAAVLQLADGIAVSSGTAALHLALLALGIGPGDEVILPSYLCVAPLNAVQYTGATPVLADCDPLTGNLAPAAVARARTSRTRAIIVPHLFGQPADLADLTRLAIPIIEDLAQGLGASIDGRPLGSFGTLAVCSFYATKMITAGEGGMVLGNDPQLLARVRDLRDYDEKPVHALRYNYKMTDFQAALGRSQIKRLPEIIADRRRIARRYQNGLQHLPMALPSLPAGSACYRYVVRVKGEPQSLIQYMESRGIICRRPVYSPLHQLLDQLDCPAADHFHNTAVSLPIYPGLQKNDQDQVIAALHDFFAASAPKPHPMTNPLYATNHA